MLESLLNFITAHKEHAPWIVTGSLLLAGLNVPISIDVVLVFCAFLAATVMPESTYALYFSILGGCVVSGWIAYWSGRLFGRRLLQTRLMAKLVPAQKVAKVEGYYQKYGIATLAVGRFIPFGIRNAIYISSGVSRMNFAKFACVDLLACTAWSSIMFYTFFHLGRNFEVLKQHLKVLNIFLFLAFSVTLITIFWYKRRKTRS